MPTIEGQAPRERIAWTLLEHHAPGDPVAFGEGGDRSAAQLSLDAARIATALPDPTPGSHIQLVFEQDRYALAATLLAAVDRGHAVAFAPNSRPDSILALQARPEVVGLAHDLDAGLGLDVRTQLGASRLPAAQDAATRFLAADRVLATVFTSGSTGPMTAWRKTSAQLIGEATGLARTFDIAHGSRILPTVSPSHIYGLLFGVLVPLASGGAFARETPHHAESIARAVGRFGAQILVSVPVQLRALARSEAANLRGIEHVFSSTGPLPDAVADTFRGRHGVAITEILGSTETGGFAHRLHDEADSRPWTPLTDIELTLDEEGRLCVDSAYVGNEHERPFVTGDLAELLPDGRFVHLGRADGIVKIAGHRVSLEAIEGYLRDQPGVEDAAVVAVPDDRGRGHRLLAALAPQDLDPARIRTLLLERLEPVCLPRRIRFCDALPREENGKLGRRQVLQIFDLDEAGRPANFALDWEPPVIEREGERIEVRRAVRIPENYAWYDGHFDGYPVLAGAVQIKMLLMPTLALVFPELGAIERLSRLRWNERILPGDALTLSLERREADALLRFEITRGDETCTSGRLKLRALDPQESAA